VVDYCGVGLPKALDAPDLHRRDISEGESRERVPFGLSSYCYGKSVRVHDKTSGFVSSFIRVSAEV